MSRLPISYHGQKNTKFRIKINYVAIREYELFLSVFLSG